MQETMLDQTGAYLPDLARTCFHASIRSRKKLGGGYYGVVYRLEIDRPPYTVVCKLYSRTGLAKKEAEQLGLLRAHMPLRMPRVFAVREHSMACPCEALMMERLPGVPAGLLLLRSRGKRMALGGMLADNLARLHAVTNPFFGELDGVPFSDWKSYYRNRIEGDYALLRQRGLAGPEVLDIAEQSLQSLDGILSEPVARPALIHGDYNLWNILADPRTMKPAGVLDPFGCCWADPELDLFQLENVHGDRFGLLEAYARRAPLSEKYPLKRDCYQFWDRVRHTNLAGIYKEEKMLLSGRRLIRALHQKERTEEDT